MDGRNHVVLLTGGTSGIGRAAARRLAERGTTVIVTGRRRTKGENAQSEIRAAHPAGRGAFYKVDFADLDAVRRLAADIQDDYDRLDAVVNNAGTGQASRTFTDDGVEKTFAINYVAPFVLTNRLVPRLRERTQSRVVNTVTVAQHDSDAIADLSWADLSNLDAVATGEHDIPPDETVGNDTSYDPNRAYVNSKLALLLFTYELADRLAGTGVRAACFHPGLIGSTDIFRDMPLRFRLVYWVAGQVARIAPVKGLETKSSAGEMLVQHVLDRDLPDGEGVYFDRRERVDPGPRARDADLRSRLWEYSAELPDCEKTVPRR